MATVTIGADGKPKVKDVEQTGRKAPLVDTAVNDQLDPGSRWKWVTVCLSSYSKKVMSWMYVLEFLY